ncbi:MAG: PQQ-binding-like beta-propeller repeat protein [Gammaproteobacteria bacterium]|nr:PQQ-binding-like beta-propeller repeat protein [Gammaproteobacteria bacterium]
MAKDDLFVAIKNSVVRIRKTDGSEMWRATLPRRASQLVTLAVEPDALYASAGGELYRIDPDSGTIIWTSELPKLGRGTVLIAATPDESPS